MGCAVCTSAGTRRRPTMRGSKSTSRVTGPAQHPARAHKRQEAPVAWQAGPAMPATDPELHRVPCMLSLRARRDAEQRRLCCTTPGMRTSGASSPRRQAINSEDLSPILAWHSQGLGRCSAGRAPAPAGCDADAGGAARRLSARCRAASSQFALRAGPAFLAAAAAAAARARAGRLSGTSAAWQGPCTCSRVCSGLQAAAAQRLGAIEARRWHARHACGADTHVDVMQASITSHVSCTCQNCEYMLYTCVSATTQHGSWATVGGVPAARLLGRGSGRAGAPAAVASLARCATLSCRRPPPEPGRWPPPGPSLGAALLPLPPEAPAAGSAAARACGQLGVSSPRHACRSALTQPQQHICYAMDREKSVQKPLQASDMQLHQTEGKHRPAIAGAGWRQRTASRCRMASACTCATTSWRTAAGSAPRCARKPCRATQGAGRQAGHSQACIGSHHSVATESGLIAEEYRCASVRRRGRPSALGRGSMLVRAQVLEAK